MVQYILARIAMKRILGVDSSKFDYGIYKAVSNVEEQAFNNLLRIAYPNAGSIKSRII